MNRLDFDPGRSAAVRDLLIDTADPGRHGSAARAGVDRQRLIVTGIVAVLVALVAVAAIRAGATLPQHGSPAETGGGSRVPVPSTQLRSVLPKASGTVLHTWSSEDATLPSGPFAAAGRTLVLTAVCEGGGTITVKTPERPARIFHCTHRFVQGPYWSFNIDGDRKATTETGPARVRVAVTSGNPSFLVRLFAEDPRILDADHWSVAPTGAAVPASLRSCAAADLAPAGTLRWVPSRHRAVVTIASRSASDCAIRSWPTMRYLSSAGRQVGPVQGADDNGKALDSAEGALNEYGQFPPARLPAGGSAFLIVDLTTEAQLEQEDAQTRAAPTPTTGPALPMPLCRPEPISAIRLTIGSATVTVPVPAAPEAAACRNANQSFGVQPVVTKRPAIERGRGVR